MKIEVGDGRCYADGDDGRKVTVMMVIKRLTVWFFSIPVAGGLVQFISPPEWRRSDTLGWVLYNLLFYLAFGVILLNVVFAIIVDTFGRTCTIDIITIAITDGFLFFFFLQSFVISGATRNPI